MIFRPLLPLRISSHALVRLLAEREWPIDLLLVSLGYLGTDPQQPAAVRAWALEPFEGVLALLNENGFKAELELCGAIATDNFGSAIALAREGLECTPVSEIDAVLRQHRAALDLAYGAAVDATKNLH